MAGPDLDRIARLTARFGRPERTRQTDMEVVAAAFVKRSRGLQQRGVSRSQRPLDAEARVEAVKKAFSEAVRRTSR